jgi:hypothetical protein
MSNDWKTPIAEIGDRNDWGVSRKAIRGVDFAIIRGSGVKVT